MMDSGKKQIAKNIFDNFTQNNTDLDFGLFLFAQAVVKLDEVKNLLFSEQDADTLLSKLKDAEELISIADSKFQSNRFPLGDNLTRRYLSLISSLKKVLKP